MIPEEYNHLTIGDWVKTLGMKATIQGFARWNGKRWIKSTRKAGTGLFLYFPDAKDYGYLHRGHIEKKLAAPLF